MANSADPDQLASSEATDNDLDLHYLQRQDISGFSRTRVNKSMYCEYSFELTQQWHEMSKPIFCEKLEKYFKQILTQYSKC